jgi:proline iminopeptidase
MIVSVEGAEIFYATRGTGVPCIMPSLVGTKPMESLTPAPLADRFQFTYVDVRGGGRSTGEPSDLTFDVLARDLDAVRADLGVDRVAVLGYSIGGALAVEYGRRFPAHVSHVILAGTPPSGDMGRLAAASTRFFEEDGSEERKQILRENIARLPPGTPPAAAVLAQTPMRFFDPRADVRALYVGSEFNPRLLEHVLGTLLARWDITSDVGSLRVPTFIAHGRYDYVVPHVMWDGIVETLPSTTFSLFERSGHQPFFEEPQRFADAVVEWMNTRKRR